MNAKIDGSIWAAKERKAYWARLVRLYRIKNNICTDDGYSWRKQKLGLKSIFTFPQIIFFEVVLLIYYGVNRFYSKDKESWSFIISRCSHRHDFVHIRIRKFRKKEEAEVEVVLKHGLVCLHHCIFLQMSCDSSKWASSGSGVVI